jgi:hypothetical protein
LKGWGKEGRLGRSRCHNIGIQIEFLQRGCNFFPLFHHIPFFSSSSTDLPHTHTHTQNKSKERGRGKINKKEKRVV